MDDVTKIAQTRWYNVIHGEQSFTVREEWERIPSSTLPETYTYTVFDANGTQVMLSEESEFENEIVDKIVEVADPYEPYETE